MKGLFQCPPWASPWVITDAPLSPCKGKSFKTCDCLSSNDSAKVRQFSDTTKFRPAELC